MTTSVPIKHLFEVSRNMVMPNDYGNEPLFHYSLPAWHENGDGIIENASDLASGKLLLKGGEVLVSKLNPEKSAVLLADEHDIPTVCSPEFIALVPKKIDRMFAYYFMLSAPLRHQLNASVESVTNSHKRARVDRFLASSVDLPDLATQRQIADFLDRETARIDLLIEKKQRLVALLGEKEGTAICDLLSASTQGTTDKRRSRLPWELELPAAWQEQTLKQTAQVIDCKHTTPVYVDDGYSLISTGEVKPYSISFVSNRQVSEDDYKNMIGGGRKPAHDDIIYSRNASVGSAAMVRDLDPFCMGQDICLIRPNNIHPQFLEHQLNSKILHLQLEPLLVGSTLKRINVNQIKNFSIIVPPRDFQHAIASEIDQLRDRTRRTTNATLQSIDRLKEYRSALITAAVTGQIDVATYAKSGTPDRRLDAIQEELGA